MDMSQYLEIFNEETKEHLQNLNQLLLMMEKKPDEDTVINEIFRVAHTLKGMSATMGFNRMAKLTHEMENVLHAIRSNEIKANASLIDLLFKCLDALENYGNSIMESGKEGEEEYSEIIKGLTNYLNKKTDAPITIVSNEKQILLNQYDQNIINKAYETGYFAYQITIRLNKGCVLKSARAFLIFKTLEKYSQIVKSEPIVEDIEDEKFDFEFTVVAISSFDQQVFHKELNSISEIDEVLIKLLEPKQNDDVATEKIMPIEKTIKAASIIKDESDTDTDTDIQQAKQDNAIRKAKTGKTVRVDIDRLDVLLNLVSELIIQKTRLEGLEGIVKTPSYIETVEYLEKITTNLHDAVMKVRMVPVETVFNRFPRMIRDIAKDLGKEVIFTMSGEETELDRTVIDEIGEPLIHLLRNAVDHGIEPIEKRREIGKTDAGNIYLRAYQDGNNVVIEVEEDGQGINIEKVRRKAIEKGFVNKEIANNLSKKEILEYLFKPSFSTADKVTDLSGRGVGLDVVKTKIEALGGTVDLETEPGNGSKFIIRLPLTLAIIQALLVIVGKEKYAIQLSSIQKILNISQEEVKVVHNQEVILFRNSVIPILRLDRFLNVQEAQTNKKILTLVIVKRGDKLTGLVVDRIIGQQEIVQKSLGKLLSGIKIISSATILGDGNVALILDVNSLVN